MQQSLFVITHFYSGEHTVIKSVFMVTPLSPVFVTVYFGTSSSSMYLSTKANVAASLNSTAPVVSVGAHSIRISLDVKIVNRALGVT